MNKSTHHRLVSALLLCSAIPSLAALAQASAESLEGTRWQLVHLTSMPIIDASSNEKPYLVFNSKSRNVTGSGGCNALKVASYFLDGDKLLLGHIAVVGAACAKGMDTQRRFIGELHKTRKWKIAGSNLELLDATGASVAVFEARSGSAQ
jgi:heat shock protein HslJ